MKFKTEVVLSFTTGTLLCPFGEVHGLAEFLVGCPVFTHQFAHRPFVDQLIESLYAQHSRLRDVDASAVTKDNWKAFRDAELEKWPAELDVLPMGECSTLKAAFVEPLRGKQVLVVKE